MSERWKNSIVLLGGGFGHQAFAFLLVAGEGSFDDGEGGIGGTDVFDLDAPEGGAEAKARFDRDRDAERARRLVTTDVID